MAFETILSNSLEALIIMASMAMFGAVAGGLIMNYMANKSAAQAQQNMANMTALGLQAITGTHIIQKTDEALDNNRNTEQERNPNS